MIISEHETSYNSPAGFPYNNLFRLNLSKSSTSFEELFCVIPGHVNAIHNLVNQNEYCSFSPSSLQGKYNVCS